MTVRLAKTAVDTRVVQSVRHMATVTIVRLAATVRLTATAMIAVHVAETVQLMVVQVQQRVAATLVK
jgi:hypothetical protein